MSSSSGRHSSGGRATPAPRRQLTEAHGGLGAGKGASRKVQGMPEKAHNGGLLVLGKIVAILDAYSLSRPSLTLSEIKEATALPASTVQRLVANLVHHNMLDRDGNNYQMGLKMAYWGVCARYDLEPRSLINRLLKGLRDDTGETATVHRTEHEHRVCIAMSETEHGLRTATHVGQLIPFPAGAPGSVLLAWDPDLLASLDLPQDRLAKLRESLAVIRREGYAISEGEREAGASAVSAPIFDEMGRVWGALSVLGPSVRVTPDKCREWAVQVVATAGLVTRSFGGTLGN